jgi:putative glutathione S-transferase
MRDLAHRFATCGPSLHPCGAESEIEVVKRMCVEGVEGAAQRAVEGEAAERDMALATLLETLGALDRRLGVRTYLIRDEVTAADVESWVALVRLDAVHRHHLDAAAVRRIAGHPALWSYARRLAARPAFGAHLDLEVWTAATTPSAGDRRPPDRPSRSSNGPHTRSVSRSTWWTGVDIRSGHCLNYGPERS